MTSKSKDAPLYGVPRPKKAPTTAPPSTLSFSAALSNLISHPTTAAPPTTSGRPRPSKHKPDIFSTHNRNASKRAASDVDSARPRKALRLRDAGDGTALGEEEWRLAKRKMEDKARLYGAMKRGDVEDDGERHMVDFDRKWAEGAQGAGEETSSDEGGESDGGVMVEYVDEYGRTRTGTAAEAAREERRRVLGERLAGRADEYAARPAAPAGIIYGDTVQSAAFDPDEPVAVRMADLAAKRDRALTPPRETHYDARAEVRSKGTGFFAFSGDEEERRRQMEGLEAERRETERKRGVEREERLEERKRLVEERRKLIREKRDKGQAERFLESLGRELEAGEQDSPAAAD